MNELKHNDFLDLHYLVDRQDWELDVNRRKVYWSLVREVVADYRRPNELQYRYRFGESLKRVRINMKEDYDEIDLSIYKPPQAEPGRFCLSDLKKKHLGYLMGKKAIPTKYHPVFEDYLSITN